MPSNRAPQLLLSVFSLSGRRRGGAISFRRFVILRAAPSANQHGLRTGEIATQPLRISLQ